MAAWKSWAAMGNSRERSNPQLTQTKKQWGDASEASTVMAVPCQTAQIGFRFNRSAAHGRGMGSMGF